MLRESACSVYFSCVLPLQHLLLDELTADRVLREPGEVNRVAQASQPLHLAHQPPLVQGHLPPAPSTPLQGECGGVYALTRMVCQHRRGKRRHTSARTRQSPGPTLRPRDLRRVPAGSPGEERSVPVGRRTCLAPLPPAWLSRSSVAVARPMLWWSFSAPPYVHAVPMHVGGDPSGAARRRCRAHHPWRPLEPTSWSDPRLWSPLKKTGACCDEGDVLL